MSDDWRDNLYEGPGMPSKREQRDYAAFRDSVMSLKFVAIAALLLGSIGYLLYLVLVG